MRGLGVIGYGLVGAALTFRCSAISTRVMGAISDILGPSNKVVQTSGVKGLVLRGSGMSPKGAAVVYARSRKRKRQS